MDRRNFLAGFAAFAATQTVQTAAGQVNNLSAGLLRLKVSDGTSIDLEEGGSGPSLLLVHGAGSFRKAWARVTPLLQFQFHTYAMDRRGHGDSTDAPAYSLEREADDVAQVAAQLPEPVFVLGHSYGGIVTLEALKRSNRFKRAALYEPPMPVSGGMVSQSPKAVCDALETGDNEAALVTFFTDYAKLSPAVIAKFRSDPTWPQRVKLAPTICREITAVRQYHFDPASFEQVKTPMMFFLGSNSPKTMETSVRTVAEVLHRPVTVLPGQQHDAMYTAPDLLARELTSYLLA
ncbi:alpha/beta fold hydrolase [Acidisarcina polymorpha]|uniref:alpha/beta fold hydrolase n=1 Tax=Acidisarcina polymorpha TaxID=2211140 RepID=UPI000DEF9058|nr:alpha/beta hydrolase [Acidisarcina polymorpha]